MEAPVIISTGQQISLEGCHQESLTVLYSLPHMLLAGAGAPVVPEDDAHRQVSGRLVHSPTVLSSFALPCVNELLI